MDDLFTLQRNRAIEFCNKFKEKAPKGAGYSIQTSLQHLDKELISVLRDSRCMRVIVGLESGNQRILNLLKKKLDIKKATEILRLLVSAKFPLGVWTLNMIANPTETAILGPSSCKTGLRSVG